MRGKQAGIEMLRYARYSALLAPLGVGRWDEFKKISDAYLAGVDPSWFDGLSPLPVYKPNLMERALDWLDEHLFR